MSTLVRIRDLSVDFSSAGESVRAVSGVSFDIARGETMALVGESGSGKTTLALALLRLISSAGPISFEDRPIQELTFKRMRPLRRRMQIVSSRTPSARSARA